MKSPAHQAAFRIVSGHPECLMDDEILDSLIDDIAAAIVAAATAPDAMREALEFYADPTRYSGPNSRLEGEGDKYQPENLYYRLDVTRDGGRIARRALCSDSSAQRGTV